MTRTRKKTAEQQERAQKRRVHKELCRAQHRAQQDGRGRDGRAPSPEEQGPPSVISRVLNKLQLESIDKIRENPTVESQPCSFAAQIKLQSLRNALQQSPGGEKDPHTQQITRDWVHLLLGSLHEAPPTIAQARKPRSCVERLAEARRQRQEREIQAKTRKQAKAEKRAKAKKHTKAERKQLWLEQAEMALAFLENSLNHRLSNLHVEFAGSILCQDKNKKAATEAASAAWGNTAASNSSKLVMCTDASGCADDGEFSPSGIAVVYKWSGKMNVFNQVDRVSGFPVGAWEAELVAIIYALRAALREIQRFGLPMNKRTVSIFSDSATALQKLSKVEETHITNHPLIFAAIAETRPLHHLNVDIELRWMPRNTNDGHSLADRLSKQVRIEYDRPAVDLKDILGESRFKRRPNLSRGKSWLR